MAKHEGRDLSLAFGIVVLALGVAAFAMMFLNCFNIGGFLGEGISFTGMQVAFGYKQVATVLGAEITIAEFGFNFMVVLAFCLPLVGAVLGFVDNFITKILSAACFGAAMVLLFTIASYFGASCEVYQNVTPDVLLPVSIACACCASGVTTNILRILTND